MSCEQLWPRESSVCTASSDTGGRKHSLADVISGKIDLAVGRATSRHGSGGLDSALHWPSRPGVITRTSIGRPMSLTYDDIISRSLMANCKNPILNKVTKHKADELGAYAIYDVASRSLVDHKVAPKSLKDYKMLDRSKDLAASTILYDLKDNSKSLKEDKMLDGPKDMNERDFFDYKDIPRSFKGLVGADYIRTLTESQKVSEVSKVSKEAVESVVDHKSKASAVPSQPVQLKATDELTSIPDFMQASSSSHVAPKVTLSRLRARKSGTLKPKTSRRLKASTSKPAKVAQGTSRPKTTPTKQVEDDVRDAQVLYVSTTSEPQTSRESVDFGESNEEGGLAFSETAERKRCDVFTEQFFEMSPEEWNNPERMFAAMREWREQQLRETRSQTPLVERANKYFHGQTFSREDLREFLRRSHSEQMDRIKNAFQGLLVIQEFLDKVNSKKDIDFSELTKELRASAAKLQPPSASTIN